MSEQANIELDQIPDRVEAGIGWLDSNYPDWEHHINPWTLDISDGNRCILGQLGGSVLAKEKVGIYVEENLLGLMSTYIVMSNMHDLGYDDPVSFGFAWPDTITKDELGLYNNALEGRWFVEIVNRQGALLRRSEVGVG